MAMKQRVNKKKASKSSVSTVKVFASTNPDKKFELGKSIPPSELLRRSKENQGKDEAILHDQAKNKSEFTNATKNNEITVQKTAKEIELEELYKYFDSLFDLSDETNEATKEEYNDVIILPEIKKTNNEDESETISKSDLKVTENSALEKYEATTASNFIKERSFVFTELVNLFQKKSNVETVKENVKIDQMTERTFSYDLLRIYWNKI